MQREKRGVKIDPTLGLQGLNNYLNNFSFIVGYQITAY